jgi:2-hydroxy-6-oxonona-2,4-dienedioate hydrolase
MEQDTELPGEARELARKATRRETPCGEGHTVWHIWGDGAPVVLLHGGSGSWTHWVRNIAAIVSAGRQAVVPDLPGFGDSANPPGGGDADAVVAPIEEGMGLLLGPQPVDVVGFSFGSLVAVLLASQMPQRVARLVMVGAPVVPLDRGRGVELRPWSRASSAEDRKKVHRHNLAAIMLHRPESIDDDALSLHDSNVLRDRMRQRRLVTTTAFQDAVVRLQCPFRALYGSEDTLVNAVWPQVEDALRANPLFGGMTVIPNSGHWVQYEEAPRFNQVLLASLAR